MRRWDILIGLLCLCLIGMYSVAAFRSQNYRRTSRGKLGVGNWVVIVKDTRVDEFQDSFVDWRLNLWGEANNVAHQQPHPFPNEHNIGDATVATTSVQPELSPTKPSVRTSAAASGISGSPESCPPSILPTFSCSNWARFWIYTSLDFLFFFLLYPHLLLCPSTKVPPPFPPE